MSDEQKRILIVDDDVTLGNVLQQALRLSSEDYQIRLARNADEALAQISRRGFDLIITDIKMEGLSGLSLLEALRQVAPDTRTIAMTAFSSGEIEKRARMLGVYDFVTKPFPIQEFRSLVNAALEATELPTPEKLPPPQLNAMNEILADLRAKTGAHATFFIEEETAAVLGVASDTNGLDLTPLAKALVDIPHRMTAEVARVFGGSSGFQRSLYVGETFNLTMYRLEGKGLLVVVYGHHVKEGIISFYCRQSLELLAQMLPMEVSPATRKDSRSQEQPPSEKPPDPSQPTKSESMPEMEQSGSSEPMSLEQALSMGLLDDDFLSSLEEAS